MVDTAYAAKSDANGVAVVRDLPAGPVVARIWHPYLRAPKNEKALAVTAVHGAARETRDDRTSPQRPLTRCSGASRPS